MKIVKILSIILIIFGIVVSFIPLTETSSTTISFPYEPPDYVFANVNSTFSPSSDCTINVSWNGTWNVMVGITTKSLWLENKTVLIEKSGYRNSFNYNLHGNVQYIFVFKSINWTNNSYTDLKIEIFYPHAYLYYGIIFVISGIVVLIYHEIRRS